MTCEPANLLDARATRGFAPRPSHVTLAVTVAHELGLLSSPRIFEQKRDCSQVFIGRGREGGAEGGIAVYFFFHIAVPGYGDEIQNDLSGI